MHIEIKIAQWKSIKIPKELEKDFANKLMNQEITDSDQAIIYLINHSETVQKLLTDKIETISPANNQGEATFQVFDKHQNLFFSNDIDEENSQTA